DDARTSGVCRMARPRPHACVMSAHAITRFPVTQAGVVGGQGIVGRRSIETHYDAAMTFERVGVVGCGLMGAGIAEVCARGGIDVIVAEAEPAAAERGRDRLLKSLDRGVRSGKLDEATRDAAVE